MRETNTIRRGLRDIVANVVELFFGPRDWRVERNGDTTTFTGDFPVYDRKGRARLRVQGSIVESPYMPAEVFLFDPPAFVKKHRHGRCLQLLRPNDKWFKLHFEKPAKDFPGAYAYIELFLWEAYNLEF